MSWTNDIKVYQSSAEEIESTATVVTKDGVWWVILHTIGSVLTLGLFAAAMPLSVFIREYGTTIGPVQGYPKEWERLSLSTIRHECGHSKQYVFFGWFFPIVGLFGRKIRAWAGILPMAIVYLLLPFPIFFAYGRYRLELEAEVTSWRAGLSEGSLTPEQIRIMAKLFGEQLFGREYFFAWLWAKSGVLNRAEKEISIYLSGVK